MKKLILSTFVTFLFLIGCNSDENTETASESISIQKKETQITSEDYLTTKVAVTFNKMVQEKNVFEYIATIFEDNIAMLTEDTIKDDVLPKLIVEDNIMMSNGVYEDNIMLSAFTIKDDLIMGKTSFEDIFIETYNQLYTENEISYSVILNSLPKLYLGIPLNALEDYNTWKENGFPTSLKSYLKTDNKLQKITKDKLIKTIGKENYEELTNTEKKEYEFYYLFSDNGKTTVIASEEKKGTVIVIENEETKIASFNIKNIIDTNSIEIIENGKSSFFKQNNMIYQTYIDIDEQNSCNGFYVLNCGTELDNFIQKKLDEANENCETYRTCLPVCCYGSIMNMMIEIEPDSFKCKKAMDYIHVLSMYSLSIEP